MKTNTPIVNYGPVTYDLDFVVDLSAGDYSIAALDILFIAPAALLFKTTKRLFNLIRWPASVQNRKVNVGIMPNRLQHYF